MTEQAPHPDLAGNLRLLCDGHGSVSEVCRKTGINRQQFNKYLAGKHLPSARNLQIIAAHFGIAPSALSLPHADFAAMVRGGYFALLDEFRRMPKSQGVLQAIAATDQATADRLVGCYDRYQYSSIYPGKIVRSAFCIYRSGPLLLHYYVERFPGHDQPEKVQYVFKYHGITIPLSDRTYTVDFESLQRNEITLSIFGNQARNARTFLFGLSSGIAATIMRQPFSTRVALHHRSSGLLRREHLRRATVLDEKSDEVPFEVADFLQRRRDLLIL